MMKYLFGVPLLIVVPTTIVGYRRRQQFLQDPVLSRALMQLQNDQRVLDFCGENLGPGWIIQKKQQPNENWVKYDLTVKGLSGKLKTTVIGDYLNHKELVVLEKEREDYYKEKLRLQQLKEALLKAAAAKKQPVRKQVQTPPPIEETKLEEKAAADEYVPVDFDAYTIPQKETLESKVDLNEKIKDEEQIWRISSLTTYVDADTKILILPLPESKRKVKIQDTKYTLNTYKDLLEKHNEIVNELEAPNKVVRYEDKTQEEVQQDIKKKRRSQISKLNHIRTYQFFIMAGAAFGYLFIYRRFFASKSVMNSAIYHQSVNFIKSNEKVMNVLGKHLQVMNVNGKISPLKSNVDFDLIIFGSNQKGKIKVKSEYQKELQQWRIHHIDLYTRNDKVQIV